MKTQLTTFTGAAVAGLAGAWLLQHIIPGDVEYDIRQFLGGISHQAGGVGTATGFHAGCSPTANPGGNSPGWYTQGPWGPGHHHCDWKSKCCFCTDVPKCIKSGTPPQQPGSCRPDWGTSGYLGGGNYPSTADFSKCPAGTGP